MENEYLELHEYEKEILFQLEESVKKQMAEMSVSIERYEDLKNIIFADEGMVKELYEKYKESERRIALYEKEISEKDALIEEQKKYDSVKLEAAKVTELLLSVQSKEKELIEKKNDYESEISRLKGKATDLENELDGKRKEYQKLNQDYQRISVELRNEQGKAHNFASTIIELKKELTEKNNEINRLRQFETTCQDIQERLNVLDNDFNWLCSYTKALDEKIVAWHEGNDSELKAHSEWLINTPKEEIFTRIFGDASSMKQDNSEKVQNEDRSDYKKETGELESESWKEPEIETQKNNKPSSDNYDAED